VPRDEIILEMRDIVKTFPGVKALDKANLRVKKGEIHALIGENGAGKSTLMKILLGIYTPDSGEIIYKGRPVNFKSPGDALTSGISMIHQEISLVPTVDVSENIWIGREKDFQKGWLIDKNRRYQATEDLLRRLKIQINPRTMVHRLSIAHMQLVELARAISYDSRVVVMDEPTSSLTDSEVRLLYAIARELSENGVSIIFISHKLDEIFDICHHVTVMRDGKYVSDHPTDGITKDQLVTEIAGREITALFPKEEAEIGDVVMEVKQLSSAGVFSNVSFEVRAGEILGFYGLVGAGRTEIMRAIFGIDKLDSGEIWLGGKQIRVKSPADAIGHRLAMVTEDRLRLGIIPNLSVTLNISLAYLKTVTRFLGFVNRSKETGDAEKMVGALNVKTPNMRQRISALSGGNQQKAIIARWLQTNPTVLILDEPTRGIDVSSKAEIHRLISMLARQGKAVIMISSELPEILGMSDRVIVVREGELAGDIPRGSASQEKLLQYAFGTIDTQGG
jgi:ABC-type sugar transport system ATPase subunit